MADHRWFISYNSQDLALAQRFQQALRQKDSDAQFFFAPTSLRAGGYWLPELAREIGEATAFVLLVGENGLGPWQIVEYYEALDRRVKQHDFPLVMVLLDGQLAPGLPFLRQLHWVVSAEPASEKTVGLVLDASQGGDGAPGELWRHTAPYRGLVAMTEADSDYFFGRGRETVDVVNALASARGKIPILLGNSGVGKSSLARAGVLAALMRQAWPETADAPGAWPAAFGESRRWCFLTMRPGTEPVTALVETFLETWQLDRTSTEWPRRRAEWVGDLIDGKLTLRDLLDQTRRRYSELQHQEPPAFLLYVDQGEELYVRSVARQRRRFSELLARDANDPRLHVLISLRSDFFGELQKDEALYGVYQQINVAPLREANLREIVSRPAALLGARFETENLARDVARRAAEELTKDAGALPLLSYLLDDMWRYMVKRGDGVLRLPANAIELGGVLVDRANAFIGSHPDSEAALRRVLTLKLATVRQDGEPTRRCALRSEFSDEEWQLVCELADYPNRLINTATPDGIAGPSETYAEVAHEAIFRRWDTLREWIGAEREFLVWRAGLEAARRSWQAAPEPSRNGALLMGLALAQSQHWLAARSADIPNVDQHFIVLSARAARRRLLIERSLASALAIGIVGGLVGWAEYDQLREGWRKLAVEYPYKRANFDPYVLNAVREHSLKSGDTFMECAKDCPQMIVVPAGSFAMGSPSTEVNRNADEEPVHKVTFSMPFAVSKFEVTFAQWDDCVAYGDCDPRVRDSGYGRGQQPAINVSWDDAKEYVAWLSGMTGKAYRLLSESEYEYAARAGTTTAYWWGNDAGTGHANCVGCASAWDDQHPSPVGSFKPNAFGLYDMAGNVWEWVEDCYHASYNRAPSNGIAWIQSGDCSMRVVRGGSWRVKPDSLRSGARDRDPSGNRSATLGFRVARTLGVPSDLH